MADEYTAASKVRPKSSSTFRRVFFFALAAIWGFSAGVGGLLAAMSAMGQAVQPGLGAILGLIPALIGTIAGSFVIAAAYKESRRHSRG